MILHGDCLEQMKTMADNSVDSLVTDPPYGLKFMGKKWDYNVPSSNVWFEVFRVLKPGGHLLSFGGTRTYHRMVVAIEDASFEIRDQIQWLYGTGFPKSHNLPGGGIGTALKPANEPIVLARKPLEKGLTVAQNVEKWGVGGINIDVSRIGTEMRFNAPASSLGNSKTMDGGVADPNHEGTMAQGRWPANLILDETAAEMLDEQSGQLKSGGGDKSSEKMGYHGGARGCGPKLAIPSSGGASRFFYVAKASKRERNAGLEGEIKEKQGARPNSADSTGKFPDHDHRPSGGNNHPTVKPIKLMEYLIRLITPPCGIVLDPFMGSGATGVAAKRLGFKFIGIEMNEEYVEIAKRRIDEASRSA